MTPIAILLSIEWFFSRASQEKNFKAAVDDEHKLISELNRDNGNCRMLTHRQGIYTTQISEIIRKEGWKDCK